jgi:hypothetical protein
MENLEIYKERKIDKSKIWAMFLFFGWSYGSMGSMGKQIFYYLTLGGLGVWTLYRFFTLNGAIKKYNRKQAFASGLNADQIMKLNLL